ncbi:MAG TPA: hypothetical protein VFL90_19955 [Methylomirabilota bacterium]|nr:hypothetical protein [Methylomirabilota bacterium]
MKTRGLACALMAVVLTLYGLTQYGGLRSPDEEVVFLAGQTFATSWRLHADGGPEGWQGFGVARAADGHDYPVFGPLESIALAPFIRIAKAVDGTSWYRGLPLSPSAYVGDGYTDLVRGVTPTSPSPHALRALTATFNVLLTALGVLLLWCLLRTLGCSREVRTLAALIYGLGTPAWAYAGTLFSEPLATTLLLAAFWRAVDDNPRAAALSGMFLGLAVATHLSAILFAPFLLLVRGRGVASVGAFVAGLTPAIAALGLYNVARFGSLFETGRSVDPGAAATFGYGTWVWPWRGLYGLLVSPGKGILIYCPIVILSALAWPAFHRRCPRLAVVLASLIVVRLVFIAARSDWHGGFGLGPRYLYMLFPFLVIPIAVWMESAARAWRIAVAAGVGFAAAVEQLYFAVGEPFRLLHAVKDFYFRRGIDIFEDDRLYLDWNLSPARHLWRGWVGPWLLRASGMSVLTLTSLGALVLAGIFAAALALALSRRARTATA